MEASMRLLLLVAFAGLCSCHPQYQTPVDEVGTGGVKSSDAVIPTHASDGSVLTDEQREALQQFWQKVEGVFGPAVTVVPVPEVHPEPLTGQCGHSKDYECVPYFQCNDGVINTDGAGLLDLRIKPTQQESEHILQPCSNVDYPDVPAVCCLVPGGKVTPAPLKVCPGEYDQCVDPYLCSAEGVIVSDGAGIIDIRTHQTKCYRPDKKIGVCCSPPKSYVDCPAKSVCVEHGKCSGKALSGADQFIDYVQTGSWQECSLPYENVGICCIEPVILDYCPSDSVCMNAELCLGTALNPSNEFVDYVSTGSWTECKADGYHGICCKQPIHSVLEYCPKNSICVEHGLCYGQALGPKDVFIDYVQTGEWQECVGKSFSGICCQQPVLDTCSYDSICVPKDKCETTALNYLDTFDPYTIGGSFQECHLQPNVYGVCCSPPPKKLITCTSDSVCVEYGSCTGTAMDLTGSFISYDPIGTWSECSLGAEYTEPGVCCIAKKKFDYPPADKCGIRNYNLDQRIQSNYADNEAAFGEFPWQSIIFYQNYTFKCGASLISNRHAITAAHCLKWLAGGSYKELAAGDIRLRFGEWQVNSFDEPHPYQDRNVYKIYIHPEYNPRNVHNDIAILELIEPITLEYHINTICLPPYDYKFYEGQECFASGWGKDSFRGNFQHILKKIELPFVEHQRCQSLLRKTRLERWFILDDSFVCAGGYANEDACYGDGGGPLVCKDQASGQYMLAGITSWGIGCGTKDVPGVYVDVKKFTSWVDNIVLGDTTHQEQQQHEPVSGYGK